MATSTLSWRAQRRRAAWGRAIFLGAATVLVMLPFLWTLLASLGITPRNSSHPPVWSGSPSLAAYAEIGTASPGFLLKLLTSLALSTLATLLAVLVAFPAAYRLTRGRWRGHRAVVQGFLILASLPVMAYIIPLSDTLRRMHLHDTFAGLALAQTAVYLPLAVYVLCGYLGHISVEFEEAARLDGATSWQILVQVMWPLALPGIAATSIILLVLNWNLFLVPLIIATGQIKTVPVAMSDFFTFERELEWPTAAAAMLTALLPLVVMVAVAHPWLEQFSLRPAAKR